MDNVDEIVGFEEPGSEVEQLAYAALGACIDVHRVLGPGYLESVYDAALRVELKLRGIPFEPQFRFALTYKDHEVGEGRVDFLVGGLLVIEIKACEDLAPIHTAQVISYLKPTNKQLALLINFNVRRLKDGVKRIAKTH
jgi:GxxExxY protein